MSEKRGAHRGGVERMETAKAQAERIVADEMARRGWGQGGIAAAPQGRCGENQDRAAIAAGNDNDVAMDGGPAKNGDMDARDQPALPPEEVILCQYSRPTPLSGFVTTDSGHQEVC